MASKNNLQNEAVMNAANQYVSQNTQQAKAKADSYSTNPYATFTPTKSTNDAYKYWQNTLANRPEDYQSNYSGTINNLLDQIVNRKEFSYDFNADPLYQQYKDQYTSAGKQAMKDTVSQVSNNTGGYSNSYAATAGSQAYQNYLQNLNDVIPQLYQQAMNKYQMDTDTLNMKYNAVGNQEDREFGQWNSKMGIWQNDRDYGLNAYSTLWNQDFQMNEFNANQWNNDRNFAYNYYRDAVGDDNTAYNNAYNAAHDALNYDYQTNRDAVSDDQWNKTFAYQQERDRIADEQWAKEFALKQAKAAASGKKEEETPKNKRIKENESTAEKQVRYNEALENVRHMMDASYGGNGEVAASGYVTNLINNGQITEKEGDEIMKELGIDLSKYTNEQLLYALNYY